MAHGRKNYSDSGEFRELTYRDSMIPRAYEKARFEAITPENYLDFVT